MAEPPAFLDGLLPEDKAKLDAFYTKSSFADLQAMEAQIRKGDNPLGFIQKDVVRQKLNDYIQNSLDVQRRNNEQRTIEAEKQRQGEVQAVRDVFQGVLGIGLGPGNVQQRQPTAPGLATPGTIGPATNSAGNNPQPIAPNQNAIGLPVAPPPRPQNTPKGPTPDQVIVDLIHDP